MAAIAELLMRKLLACAYRRHEVVALRWDEQFGTYWPRVLQVCPYSFVSHAAKACASNEAVQTELALPDLRNEMVALRGEVYSNQHNLFVLVCKERREALRRRRIIVPMAKPA